MGLSKALFNLLFFMKNRFSYQGKYN